MIEAAEIKGLISLRAYLAEHGAVFIRDKARCLFHEDRTPSASLYRGKDGYERLRCFGCGADVDLIGAAQEIHGLDFKGAIKMLADRAGISTHRTPADAQARMERERKQELLKIFRAWEQTQVNEISAVLRAFRSMKARAKTQAELITLAEVQGEMDALEDRYEIFCRKDDCPKFELYQEMTDGN